MQTIDIERQALEELAAEAHRAAVDQAKVRIQERRARPLWKRLIPFTIKIERRS